MQQREIGTAGGRGKRPPASAPRSLRRSRVVAIARSRRRYLANPFSPKKTSVAIATSSNAKTKSFSMLRNSVYRSMSA